jgi:hypothetical protein
MDSQAVIHRISNEENPRDLYDVPVMLCIDDISFEALTEATKEAKLVNQLGALVDLTLQYLIDSSHPRYENLQHLRENLWQCREQNTSAFYSEKDPRIMAHNKKRTNEFLKPWNLICVLSPEKFKQVYTQAYEDRQVPTI